MAVLQHLSEDQELLRQSVREFALTEVAPLVGQMEQTNRFPSQLIKRYADLGLTGLIFPEQYGGSAQGLTSFCVALEEISRVSQTCAIVLDADMTLCFAPILYAGSQEQKDKYLPLGINGEMVGAYAMSEPPGATNFPAHQTKAVKEPGGWRITGTKIFCTNSQLADLYIVFAQVDGSPMPTCFLVEKGTDGLSFGEIEEKLGWHGSMTGTIHLDGVYVDDSALLGVLHQGLAAVMNPIYHSCVGIGAMCVGSAAGVTAKTQDYISNRVLVGTKVADQPTVRETMARMVIGIESARALVYRTAALIDEGQAPDIGSPVTLLTTACKVYPPETAAWVCDQAIQLHGGHGYTNGLDIHRYWRDVRVCQIGEGPTYGHLDTIAQFYAADPSLI